MFWNYCLASGFFVLPMNNTELGNPQNLQPLSFPTSSTLPTGPQEKLLDLSIEDHLKAGYEKKKKLWDQEEDKKLKKLREKDNLEWEEIAIQIPGRNAKMCYSRFKRLEYHPRENWKKSENQKICQMVAIHGENWDLIAKQLKGRRPKQIKEHYMNYLKPEVSKAEWDLTEDIKLTELLNKYGTEWKMIEGELQGRTQNQIKNRYFGRLKKLHDKKTKSSKTGPSEQHIL